jgi:hypothetical protein
MFMKKQLMSVLILTVLLLTSCSASTTRKGSALLPGIQITEMDSAIGGSEDNPDRQIFSYHFVLQNQEPFDIVVHWIEPVLVKELSERVLTADYRVQVERSLAPNSYLEISGKFPFGTKGVTKMEISGWQPFFTGIRVSSEITLPIPGQEAK